MAERTPVELADALEAEERRLHALGDCPHGTPALLSEAAAALRVQENAIERAQALAYEWDAAARGSARRVFRDHADTLRAVLEGK